MGASTANGSNDFQDEFDKLTPLIREEWPAVDADALSATGGDYERVVALIAEKTDHTKALVKRQLCELRALSAKPTGNGVEHRLEEMLHKLHERSNEIAGYVKKQMLADAKHRVTENPIVSLLMAIGLGVILGFILRGGGRRGGYQP
jgi:ElaB/YqjD/DUF883 family membrane-anchored ribosome-binding protein